jgi:hypothetical protein
MLRRLPPKIILGLICLALPFQTALSAPRAPLSQWVPQDAVMAVELSRPKPLLDLATDPGTLKTVTSLPVYKKLAAERKYREFLSGVAFLEARLDTPWPTALHKLLDGGVLASVHPRNGVLVIVETQDKALLDELHEVVMAVVRGQAKKAGQLDQVTSREYQGVTAWTFGGNEAHAIAGNYFLMSNQPALLKAALDLRAKQGPSLASAPAYQAAQKAAGPDAVAVAYANMDVLKLLPGVQKALASKEQPLAALLFRGVTSALGEANWLGLGLNLEQKTLTLKATVDGKSPSDKASFAIPSQPGQGVLPNFDVPGRIAAISLFRDLHGFYAAKDDLFPERTSGLILFENMMGIFFSGRDLTEEVFGETRPELRFVVAQQKYDTVKGTPGIQIPSFAAIFRVREPDKDVEIAEEAWQKALGLINITRGQKALPGLIISRETYHDTPFTLAYFSTVGVKDNEDLDIRFNFRPALARVGEYLILASTDGLARDLIDAAKKEAAGAIKALSQTHSLIEVNGNVLASVLQANREVMVRQNMVEKGKSQEQAENEFDLVVTLVRHLDRAKLDVGSHDGQSQATLELNLQLP